jgi:catechol 2,3-dioxygenase-like lactoylglutathione lyase family enzyme
MKVSKHVGMLYVAGLMVFALSAGTLVAQLPAPNASGVSTGHIHLSVPDAEQHREIWHTLGATDAESGRLQLLNIPGMYILLTEREPTAPSTATTANHMGFSVQSYADIHAKLEQVGATFAVENAETGQLIADLPDGVRVEMQEVEGLSNPIEFHHIHLSVADQEGLRDWYVEAFGAEVGERRGMPSAVIPGGRVDFLGARGGSPMPTQGTAIDHIGFEVADMDAFAARMADMGVTFDREPSEIAAIGLTIAFITDPEGTYIEITEGLANVQ